MILRSFRPSTLQVNSIQGNTSGEQRHPFRFQAKVTYWFCWIRIKNKTKKISISETIHIKRRTRVAFSGRNVIRQTVEKSKEFLKKKMF